MQFFGLFINRAIISHLLVAVPPAVVLGQMVIDINETALRQETQLLHLFLATQIRDAIRQRAEASAMLLGHAERILDTTELTIVERQTMLRALVADGRLPYLALYKPDGVFDSLISPNDAPDVDRAPLPAGVRTDADIEPWTVWDDAAGPRIIVAWRRDQEVLGFLASRLSQEQLQTLCREIGERYLGAGGRVDVVARDGRYVASSMSGEPPERSRSAFSMVRLSGAGGLTRMEAGVSGDFIDPAGEPQLGTVVSAPKLGWMVAASRPHSVAFESLEKVRLRVILMSIIAALAAGLVALIMARQISQPVQKLVFAVRRAAQRGFSLDSQVRASGELGQLAKAFNHALAQMAEFRRQIRQTAQLRLRLSRFGSSTINARELLARATSQAPPGPPEPMTVLYADVLFEEPDSVPTDHLVTILGEFFSAAHDAIRKEGGRLDRYSGDAVIGVFPREQVVEPTHAALSAARTIESDAQAISERWRSVSPIRLSASIGVVTGEARLMTEDDPAADPTVYGDLVERAAALQRRAHAGMVLIDQGTATAVQLKPLPPGGAVVESLPDDTGEAAFVWTPPGES